MSDVVAMRKLAAKNGFIERPAEGVLNFRRTHPDGREQGFSVFWWGPNPKVADRRGLPHEYLVVRLNLGSKATAEELESVPQRKYRGCNHMLPTCSWPAQQQRRRTWEEVASEFEDVYVRMFDMDEVSGQTMLATLDLRYGPVEEYVRREEEEMLKASR